MISTVALDSITKVLNMVQLDCIQEMQVTWIWHLSILAMFAPLLGQTSNVQKPRLSGLHGLPMRSSSRKLFDFPSVSKLHRLQSVYLDSPSLSEPAWTRCSGEGGPLPGKQ